MRKVLLSIVLFMAVPVFGQMEPHILTMSATRNISLQPDQALLSLSVTSNTNQSLDQIVAALSGLGINSTNFTGFINNTAAPNFQWNFNWTAPLSNLTTTIGSLTKLQQTIAQNNSGLALAFYIDGTEVSQQLQQSQSCSNSDLTADATAQAQKLAAAAGLTLGPIVKISNTPVVESGVLGGISYVSAQLYAVPGVYRLGDFSGLSFAPPSPSLTCSLFVTFRLLP